MAVHKKATDRWESEWNWTHHHWSHSPLKSMTLSRTKWFTYLTPFPQRKFRVAYNKGHGSNIRRKSKRRKGKWLQVKTNKSYYKWRSNSALAPTLATVADVNEQAWEEQIKILWPKPSFTDPSLRASQIHGRESRPSEAIEVFHLEKGLKYTLFMNPMISWDGLLGFLVLITQGHLTWIHGWARSPWTL